MLKKTLAFSLAVLISVGIIRPVFALTPLPPPPPILRLAIGETNYMQYPIERLSERRMHFYDTGQMPPGSVILQSPIAPYVDPAYDRAMAPLFVLTEAFGVDARVENNVITIYANDSAVLNFMLYVPFPDGAGMPVVVDGCFIVPINYIAMKLGSRTRWDGEAGAVYVFPLSSSGRIQTNLNMPTRNYIRSNFVIPNTRLTPIQRRDWVREYNSLGGISLFELEVVSYINRERVSVGLQPLEISQNLMQSSRFKSQSMVNLDYFGYENPVYGSNLARMEFGYISSNFAEIFAIVQRTPHEVVNTWMSSDRHRANILNPNFSDIGVGLVLDIEPILRHGFTYEHVGSQIFLLFTNERDIENARNIVVRGERRAELARNSAFQSRELVAGERFPNDRWSFTALEWHPEITREVFLLHFEGDSFVIQDGTSPEGGDTRGREITPGAFWDNHFGQTLQFIGRSGSIHRNYFTHFVIFLE